jgi:polyferredoxin
MVFTQCAKAAVERFMSNDREDFMNSDDQKHLKALVMLILWLVVTLLVGMWLWNNIAVKVVTVLKPLTSIWQLLGFALLVDLIHPACC